MCRAYTKLLGSEKHHRLSEQKLQHSFLTATLSTGAPLVGVAVAEQAERAVAAGERPHVAVLRQVRHAPQRGALLHALRRARKALPGRRRGFMPSSM